VTQLGVVVVLLIGGVALAIPHALLLIAAAVFLFRPVGRFIGRRSGWLVKAIGLLSVSTRRRIGWSVGIAGFAVLFVAGAPSESSRFYALAGAACQQFGVLALLTGGWLILVPAGVPKARELDNVRVAQGRLLGWLIMTMLAGETLWILATASFTRYWVSYRLYTIWAVLELMVLGVMVGSLLDTWQCTLRRPIRLAGVLVGAMLFFATGVPLQELLESARSPRTELPTRTADDWPDLLLRRINAIPVGDPIVLVACSGGGSRAAIFAELVLEDLARQPFEPGSDTKWGDHIVLISAVSGGSLGTARFIESHDHGKWQGQCCDQGLRNTVKEDLLDRMVHTAHRIHDSLSDAELARVAEDVEHFCKGLQAHDQNLDGPKWIVTSCQVDDMCTGFMAPVLRGVLAPNISRSQTLRHFWAEQYGWIGHTDDSWAYAPADSNVPPLAIYSASDVHRGTRVAMGFPPLPSPRKDPTLGVMGFLQSSKARDPSAISDGRYRPETLADVDPNRRIELAQAVGLSANFPFGFNVIRMPRNSSANDPEDAKDVNDPNTDIAFIDGGVVDNTGIDTLYLAIQGIKARAGLSISPYQELGKKSIGAA
jgi:hypothetical protein